MLKPFFVFWRCPHFNQSLLLLFLFSWSAGARMDLEGSVRFRALFPQTQIENSPSFLPQGRLHLKGDFYPSNKWKAQVHFLSANPYGPLALKDSLKDSFREFFKAYPSVNWLLSDYLELKIGRNIYENKFHHIVSANDYEPFFYAFDGFFLEYSAQIINVNLWGASLPKRWVGDKQVREFKYGFGFFLDIKSVSDYIEYFNAYAAYLGDSLFEEELQMSRYGFGFQGAINLMNLSYTVSAAGHGKGIQFSLEEDMYHFHLSYSRPEFFDSKIFAGYHTDSSNYNPWLYDRHKSAGLADIFLWGNLTYYFVGLGSSLGSLLDIQILFYDLKPTAKGDVHPGYFGALLEPEISHFRKGMDYQSLGQELDIQLRAKINPDFELQFLAGVFVPHSKNREIWDSWTDLENFYSNIQLTGLYRF